MLGLDARRLSDLETAAEDADIETSDWAAEYEKFADAVEEHGNKTRFLDSDTWDWDDCEEVKELNGENVLIFSREEGILSGRAYTHDNIEDNGLHIVLKHDNSDKYDYVDFEEMTGICIERPANYKTKGFVSTDDFSYKRAKFWEDVVSDCATAHGYNKFGNGPESVPEDIKRLDGETVLLQTAKSDAFVLGQAKYSEEGEPALDVQINDEISCKVKLADIKWLDVEEKEKDLLGWRPNPIEYRGVPQDVFEARMNLIPEEVRGKARNIFKRNSLIEAFYFGTEATEEPLERRLPSFVYSLAGYGLKAEDCAKIAKTAVCCPNDMSDDTLIKMCDEAVLANKKDQYFDRNKNTGKIDTREK